MSSAIDGTPLFVAEELSQAGNTINSSAMQIVDELRSLTQQLQPLADTWQGPAASYFDPLMQEWLFAAIGMFGTGAAQGIAPVYSGEGRINAAQGNVSQGGLLGEIAAAMNLAYNNYVEGETANTSTWRSGS
jgi:hypothetical protein